MYFLFFFFTSILPRRVTLGLEPANKLESSALMLETEVRHQRYAMIAAVCATAVLGIALFNRVSNTGPCTFNSFQRSAVCSKLSVLPGTIPENTQVIIVSISVLTAFNFQRVFSLLISVERSV